MNKHEIFESNVSFDDQCNSEFRGSIVKIERELPEEAFDGVGSLPVSLSFASNMKSKSWITTRTTWAVVREILAADFPIDEKNGFMALFGSLWNGDDLKGTRKIRKYVEQLDGVFLDFDKGDVTREELEERVQELEFEAAIFPSYSDGKTETTLDWETSDASCKKPVQDCRFKVYSKTKTGNDDLSPSAVTPDIVKSYMTDELHYRPEVLGEVLILETNKVTKFNGTTRKSFVVKHNPIQKSRLCIPLSEPFRKRKDETHQEFNKRWADNVYHPVGRLLGFDYDQSCGDVERGFYAMTRNANGTQEATRFTSGKPLDISHPEISSEQEKYASAKETKCREQKSRIAQKKARRRISSQKNNSCQDWCGFQAADAAVNVCPNHQDKREDPDNPLVAVPCPFVHEHATSNDPSARQCYMYNSSRSSKVPVVKCHAETCANRSSEEFLDALFDNDVRNNAAYRLTSYSKSGRIVREEDLNTLLFDLNQTWAVSKAGNKTRFAHFLENGQIEFLDSKSAADWLSNWVYLVEGDDGKTKSYPVFDAWKKWECRRQYHAVGFYPNSETAPDGVLNLWTGYSVEQAKGDWSLLLRHIYRNVCQRDPHLFYYVIAWMAQLVQEPDQKIGVALVLRGKEGVGKSKLCECLGKLFGKHAMVISDQERITGRFNAHFEDKMLVVGDDAFWAGDKAAEGKLKDFLTNSYVSYERKGLDPYEGPNFTRFMFTSNEEWCFPAGSGGRRALILDVGDEKQQDHEYFAAIDEQMINGGLSAMLYDLLRHDFSAINVRQAPETQARVEQRLHSLDSRYVWLRDVIFQGGFSYDDCGGGFVKLSEECPTQVPRNVVYKSGEPYFDKRGRKSTSSQIGMFLKKELDEVGFETDGPRIKDPGCFGGAGSERVRTYVFPSLKDLRDRWYQISGEQLSKLGSD